MTVESTPGFIDHYWTDRPGAALLQVDGTPSAPREAITDLRQTLPAVRLTGICTGRQSERWIGGLLAALRHQLRLDDAHEEAEGRGPSLQSLSEPVPILEQAQMSVGTPCQGDVPAHVSAGFTAARTADRLGVNHKTIEIHEQRIDSTREVHSHTLAMSVAFERSILDRTYALVSQPSLPSA